MRYRPDRLRIGRRRLGRILLKLGDLLARECRGIPSVVLVEVSTRTYFSKEKKTRVEETNADADAPIKKAASVGSIFYLGCHRNRPRRRFVRDETPGGWVNLRNSLKTPGNRDHRSPPPLPTANYFSRKSSPVEWQHRPRAGQSSRCHVTHWVTPFTVDRVKLAPTISHRRSDI